MALGQGSFKERKIPKSILSAQRKKERKKERKREKEEKVEEEEGVLGAFKKIFLGV